MFSYWRLLASLSSSYQAGNWNWQSADSSTVTKLTQIMALIDLHDDENVKVYLEAGLMKNHSLFQIEIGLFRVRVIRFWIAGKIISAAEISPQKIYPNYKLRIELFLYFSLDGATKLKNRMSYGFGCMQIYEDIGLALEMSFYRSFVTLFFTCTSVSDLDLSYYRTVWSVHSARWQSVQIHFNESA